MYLILAILAAPLLFFMIIWALVTAYRIYFPEKPLPFEKAPVMMRRQARAAGHSMPVGVREIRADQRDRYRVPAAPSYNYTDGFAPEGLPADWKDELWLRRN
jgi:hypothetical protein